MRKSFVVMVAVAAALSAPAFGQDQGAVGQEKSYPGLQPDQTLEEEAGVARSGTGANYGVVEGQGITSQEGTASVGSGMAAGQGTASQDDALQLDTGMTPDQGITRQGTVSQETLSQGLDSQGAAGQGGAPLEEEMGPGTAGTEDVIPGGMVGGDTSDVGEGTLGDQGQGGSAAGGSTGSSQTGGSTGMTGGGGGTSGGSAGGGSGGGGS